jgi:hypothetical protein
MASRRAVKVGIVVGANGTSRTPGPASGSIDVVLTSEAWEPIEYTDAVYDDRAQRWISSADVAQLEFTTFSGRKRTDQLPGRLVVRRIPGLNRVLGWGPRRSAAN